MSRQLEKLLERQRKLEAEIAAAKVREAAGRRLLVIAKKAGADQIEDDAYWQSVFSRAVADYATRLVQQPAPLVVASPPPEEA